MSALVILYYNFNELCTVIAGFKSVYEVAVTTY